MSDELPMPMDDAAAEVETVGFDNPPMIEPEPAKPKGEASAPVVAAKPRRRGSKRSKRAHLVRVVFDDDEFRKLSIQAGGQKMTLPEFVRRRALQDPRTRGRSAAPPEEDLFAPDMPLGKAVEMTVVRLRAPLSPDLERRINAYFAASDRLSLQAARLALPPRPNVFARLGQLVTDIVGARWPGHRATPPART